MEFVSNRATGFVSSAERNQNVAFISSLLENAQEEVRGASRSDINILGADFYDVISDTALMDVYLGSMMTDVDERDAHVYDKLFQNSAKSLQLSALKDSVATISRVGAVQFATMRALLPQLVLTDAFETVVPEEPSGHVKYKRNFIRDQNGNKYYIPEDLLGTDPSEPDPMAGNPLWQDWIPLADFDPGSGTVNGANKGFKLFETLPPGFSTTIDPIRDTVDRQVMVGGVRIETTDLTSATAIKEVSLSLGFEPTNRTFTGVVEAYADADYNADGTLKPGAVKTVDQIMGQIDYETGVFSAVCFQGNVKEVRLKHCKLSVEPNIRTPSVDFEMTTKPYNVTEGEVISANMTQQTMDDAKATHGIDSAAEKISTMSLTLSINMEKKTWRQVLEYFDEFPRYVGEFDCKPPTTYYRGTPIDWLSSVRHVTNFQANDLQDTTYLNDGMFSLVGNRMDIGIYPNVQWQMQTDMGNQVRNGILTGQNIGFLSDSNAFRLYKSSIPARGAVYGLFQSNVEMMRTYIRLVHSFAIRDDYVDPNAPTVPGVVAINREQFMKFRDGIFKVNILNNDGRIPT